MILKFIRHSLIRSPLISSIGALDRKKDGVTMAFYSLILVVFLIFILMPYTSSLQDVFMAKFHLSAESFQKWAVWQLFPSMYNFGNEIWISPVELPKTMLKTQAGDVAGAFHDWVNHYPLRLISFNLNRKKFHHQNQYIYIRTQYRQNTLWSVYRLSTQDSRLVLELIQSEF